MGKDALLGLLVLLPLGLLLGIRPAIRHRRSRSRQAGDLARERQPDLVS